MISGQAYLVTEPQSRKPVGAEMKARKSDRRKVGRNGNGRKKCEPADLIGFVSALKEEC